MLPKYIHFLLLISVFRNVVDVSSQNITFDAPNHLRMMEKLLVDAGCKGMKYDEYNHKWIEIGVGKLLKKGACIPDTYDKNLDQTNGKTIVYTTLEKQKVRSVDDQESTLTVDVRVTMKWVDPLISTNFSKEDEQNGGIALGDITKQHI